MVNQETLERIILNLLNGKLRSLVEVCNCQDDRKFLAMLLAEEITTRMEENENELQ